MSALRFVLFAATRTGSTMLTEGLSLVPQTVCLPAIFSQQEWDAASGRLAELKTRVHPSWHDLQERLECPFELIDELDALADERAFGWKHHIVKEFDLNALFLASPGLRKILLKRGNLLACYSSNKIAVLKRDGLETGTCRFIKDEFLRYARRRARLYEEFEGSAKGIDMLSIEYLEARTPDGFGRILDYLDMPRPAEPAQAPTRKRNSDDILSRFENPEQVERALASIGKTEWMFEGVPR